jgi:hypothetical protein
MTGQTAISLEVYLAPVDIYRLSLTNLLRRFRWIIVIAGVVILFVVFLNVKAGQWDWSWQNLLGPVLFFVLVPYGIFISPYFAARKYLRENSSSAGPLNYTFSERGIEVSGPHSQSRLDWEAIVRAEEAPSQFLIYPQTAIVHIIPKRFLTNPTDQDVLRALIRANLKNSKLAR